VSECRWRESGEEFQFTITANRFLHSMVRAIVGFCVKYAHPSEGTLPALTLNRIRDILTAGTWTTDHLIAPPQGLYLVRVRYPED